MDEVGDGCQSRAEATLQLLRHANEKQALYWCWPDASACKDLSMHMDMACMYT